MMKNVKKVAALFMTLALVLSVFGGMKLNVSAAEGPVIKLHYHRNDGAYDGWDVWLWEFEKDGAGYAFADEGGEKVATMNVTPGCVKVGFIVRTAAWEKDVNEDQFIDIVEVVSGTVHVYVESGVKGYTKSYGEDAVVGIKVQSVKYNIGGTIDAVLTADPGTEPAEMFALKGSDGDIAITGVTNNGNGSYTLTVGEELDTFGSYYLTYDGIDYKLVMPILFSTDTFEAAFTYTGDDLGAMWSKESTAFRLWAPTADEVYVNLYESGTAGTEDLIKSVQMTKAEQGTWTANVSGDLNGTYYTYLVNVNGAEVEACDPYARTTGVNGDRAMVIDLASTNPSGWENDKNPHAGENITDAIIYEAQIRDLTVNSDGNILNRGKYLGVTETGTKTSGGSATGLDHLKELGITHLHILPMYDFGSVDETSPINKYNWGYDPKNYNVPEGSYATDPYNGDVRVSEVKTMVQTLHDNGISVVMDVVYNHVQSASDFCFNKIVPGYFSRINANGGYSNGSGCGNDTASERSMVRKYIVDSVNYWADEYHIDGFRFDLVGLLDVDTINEIVETVHAKHPDVIFYGEGWTLTTATTKDDVVLATQTNSDKTPGFAYFNDTIRDAIKGSVFNTAAGFASGAAGMESKIERCFLGSDTWCKSPSQTINYASCHDNNTLFDRLRLSCKDTPEEDIIRMNNLSAAIYMLSEGIPFMASGEEMLRSKTNKDGTYNDNSYNAGDTVNTLKWATLDDPKYAAVFDYYKGLISFRRSNPVLRLTTAEEVGKYVSVIDGLDSSMVGIHIADGCEGEEAGEMYIYFNASEEDKEITLPEGEWGVCIDSAHAGTEWISVKSGTCSVERLSALVLTKNRIQSTKAEETSDASAGAEDILKNNGDLYSTSKASEGTSGPSEELSESSNGLSAPAVAGIIGGAAVIVAAVFVLIRKKKK